MLVGASEATQARAERWAEFLKRLARLAGISPAEIAPAGAVQLIVRGETVALPLKGVIDFAAERARLEKEMARVNSDIARIDAKLGNADFIRRAPEDVVEGEREKRDEAELRRAKLNEALERLKGAAYIRPGGRSRAFNQGEGASEEGCDPCRCAWLRGRHRLLQQQARQSRQPGVSMRQFWVAASLLWLAGAGLRMTLLAVPPVLVLMQADLNLSGTEIGLLSGLPVILFAVAALPGSLLIARFGALPTLVAGLADRGVASALRGAALNVAVLYAATIVMSAGIAIMQPALPPLVRAWLPRHISFGTRALH